MIDKRLRLCNGLCQCTSPHARSMSLPTQLTHKPVVFHQGTAIHHPAPHHPPHRTSAFHPQLFISLFPSQHVPFHRLPSIPSSIPSTTAKRSRRPPQRSLPKPSLPRKKTCKDRQSRSAAAAAEEEASETHSTAVPPPHSRGKFSPKQLHQRRIPTRATLSRHWAMLTKLPDVGIKLIHSFIHHVPYIHMADITANAPR